MTTFADLGLSPSTVQAVADTGYATPTPIQEQAVPVALAGRDVLGIAQTGTGKTAAFTLPMIDRLSAGRAKARMPRSLVVAPTRELADQVAASFDKYAKGTRLSWALLIGGVSFADQEAKLDRGVDVLIATPGRLLDFYERRKIMLLDVKTLVVDEADRMLDMGFIPDLERIFEITPKAKQTLFFSATMPPEITRLTGQFLKDPTRIEVARPATTNENIKQFVAKLPMAEPKAKRMALRALIERAEPESGIVFCNRKSEVDVVAKSLQKYGYDAAPIHGDLDQSQRMRTLDAFRKGELKLLVASDVAARGLDIPQVSDVFNYDVPHQADDYVHRIGRTGRAGRSGETFMIVTPADERSYDKVVKLTKVEPEEVVLELDWEEARRGAERDRERYGSRRDRGDRDGRGRDRDRRERPVADHGQRASMEAISTPEAGEPAPVETPAPPPVRDVQADEARREDRPRRDRDRGRRRDREARGPRGEPATPATPEASSSTAHDEQDRAGQDRGHARRDERDERDERYSRRGERDRVRGPRSDRGDRGTDRWDRDDRAVIGFGGEADTPAFLLRSAAAAIAALQRRGAAEDVEEGPEPEAEAAAPASETEAPPARRRRRGERVGSDVVAAADPVADAADPVADAKGEPPVEGEVEVARAEEAAAAEDAVSAQGAGREPRRSRRRVQAAAEPAPTEAGAGGLGEAAPAPESEGGAAHADAPPVAKRVRTRRRTAEPEAAAPDIDAPEPAPKPRRTRRAAAAPPDVDAARPEAVDAAPSPPRRPRRRKAEAVAEEISDALPGDVIPG